MRIARGVTAHTAEKNPLRPLLSREMSFFVDKRLASLAYNRDLGSPLDRLLFRFDNPEISPTSILTPLLEKSTV
jgi:hypothetical protein